MENMSLSKKLIGTAIIGYYLSFNTFLYDTMMDDADEQLSDAKINDSKEYKNLSLSHEDKYKMESRYSFNYIKEIEHEKDLDNSHEISGKAWIELGDDDKKSLRESNELNKDDMKYENLDVYLEDSKGNVIKETQTDDKGYYNFKGLKNGKYYVSFNDEEGLYPVISNYSDNPKLSSKGPVDKLIILNDSSARYINQGYYKIYD